VNTTFEIRSKIPISTDGPPPITVEMNFPNQEQERDWSTLLKAAKLDAKITGKAAVYQRQMEKSNTM
jgi:hypothetical protein